MDLTTIKLAHGKHASAEKGVCLMEAVAYVAGLPHSDHPPCTDPVLGAFARQLNDSMDAESRQMLVSLIPKLIGTAGSDALSVRRGQLLAQASVHVFAPLALRAVGLDMHAEALQATKAGDWSAAESAAWSAAWSAESAAWSAESAAKQSVWTEAIKVFEAAIAETED